MPRNKLRRLIPHLHKAAAAVTEFAWNATPTALVAALAVVASLLVARLWFTWDQAKPFVYGLIGFGLGLWKKLDLEEFSRKSKNRTPDPAPQRRKRQRGKPHPKRLSANKKKGRRT